MSGDDDRPRPGDGSGGDPLDRIWAFAGRLLCVVGWHDYVVVSRTFGFGPSGDVEKVECRRCGHVTARHG